MTTSVNNLTSEANVTYTLETDDLCHEFPPFPKKVCPTFNQVLTDSTDNNLLSLSRSLIPSTSFCKTTPIYAVSSLIPSPLAFT